MGQKILNGVNTLADNVGSTLGPRGRNVILQEKSKRPIIIIAKYITNNLCFSLCDSSNCVRN